MPHPAYLSLVFKIASKMLVKYLMKESYLKPIILCLNNNSFCILCYNAFQELEWTCYEQNSAKYLKVLELVGIRNRD
jgi:hypothetical protein